MTRPRRRARGYTLTELMMVVAITGVLFAAGPPMLVQLQNFWLMTNARNSIERDARASLDLMNRFIRQAKLSTMTIDTPPTGGPYSRISFTTIDGKTVQFYQAAPTLYHSPTTDLWANINGNTSKLSKNLLFIAFTFPETTAPSIVSVAITMGQSIQLGRKKVLELTIQKVRVMNQ